VDVAFEYPAQVPNGYACGYVLHAKYLRHGDVRYYAGTTWSPSVWLGRVRDLPQNVYGFENLVCGYTHLLPNPEHAFHT